MKQGCLLLSPDIVSNCDILDAILDNFELVRSLEVIEDNLFVFIVENEAFLDTVQGDVLPFYDLEMSNAEGQLQICNLTPYIHSKYFIQCQNKQEPPRQEQENPLIWVP